MTDSLASEKKKHNRRNIKNFPRILEEGKKTAIFFDIKNAYDKFNRDKTLKQLENMGIRGRMLRFIRKLIGER